MSECDDSNSLIISISEEMNPKYRCTMEDCCVYHPPSFFRINGRNPPVPVKGEVTTSPQKKRPRSEQVSTSDHLGNSDDRWHMMGVYDGHGGREIANYLEQHLGQILKEELHADDSEDDESDVVAPVLERIERSMLLADVDSYRRGIHASGATVVLCLVRQEPPTIQRVKSDDGCPSTNRPFRRCTIYTANCGDARAVLYDPQGRVSRLSFDHKADDRKEKQRVEDAGGFVLKGRVLGVLAVARSMGDHLLKEFVTSRPHLQETVIEYDPGDFHTEAGKVVIPPFLIIACDGLWDVVGDEEAARLVRRYIRRHIEKQLTTKTSKEASDSAESDEGSATLHDVAKVLTSEALRRGSTDNVSIIVTILR